MGIQQKIFLQRSSSLFSFSKIITNYNFVTKWEMYGLTYAVQILQTSCNCKEQYGPGCDLETTSADEGIT